tara:strand:- start:3990 stop:4775 length:786 start_codon:yes stop_codon:yes gene_type:complete
MPPDDFDEIPQIEGNTISGPTAASEPTMDSPTYYDSDDVSRGEMGSQGPVLYSPRERPAAPYVVVRRDQDAGTTSSQLVAAERAISLGRFDSALDLYEMLERKIGDDGRVLMGKAISLQKLGRFDEAMKVYEKISKLDPDNLDVKQNMLGLLATRYPAVAQRRLLELYQDNADNVGIVSQLAFAYSKSGDFPSALRYLGVASSMEPHNANHIYNMAIIYDQHGDTDNAIKYYEEALEVDTLYGSGRTIPRDAVFERLAQIR